MKFKIGGKEFEVSNEDVTKAIEENKEVSIDADIIIREKAEEETFVNNLKTESKQAGIEIAVKEARTKLGLDFQGKTIDNLIEAHKNKVLEDAKIEPAKQVESLTKDLTTLKATIQTVTAEKEQIEQQFKGYKSESIINSIISSSIPDNVILPKNDMELIVRNKIKLSLDENNNVLALNERGEVLKNPTTLEPLKPNDVISDFFAQNTQYMKGASGGAGGNDSSGGQGKIKLSEFITDQQTKGIAPNSPQFITELEKLQKESAIDMDK